MTDKEIIHAFSTNDQRGIREAYNAWRAPFVASVKSRTQIDDDYVDDAYQEAIIRLQQHILTGRLTEENHTGSLLAYVKEIGYYTSMELIRGRREIPEGHLIPDQSDDDESMSDNETDSNDAEGIELGIYDPMAHYYDEERERVVREQVMQIGEPCSSLLLGFYWENKSMETLATELNYSNADSAKSQKAKCMRKLIAYSRNRLREYGYGY